MDQPLGNSSLWRRELVALKASPPLIGSVVRALSLGALPASRDCHRDFEARPGHHAGFLFFGVFFFFLFFFFFFFFLPRPRAAPVTLPAAGLVPAVIVARSLTAA